MATARTPKTPAITKGILKLARQIDAKSTPENVPVEPGEGCVVGGSFENVPAVVKRHGGSMQIGWRMREQELAFVEGAFHAVWRRPDGALIDVTPQPDQMAGILFLPDTQIEWRGEDVDPRRLMLNQQPCYCGSGMPFQICHGAADE